MKKGSMAGGLKPFPARHRQRLPPIGPPCGAKLDTTTFLSGLERAPLCMLYAYMHALCS